MPRSAARRPRCPRTGSGRAVAHLARLLAEHPPAGPDHLAVRAVHRGDDLEVAFLPLGTTHPFAALAGFTAPPEWAIFGLDVRGTAHHLEDGTAQRSRTVHLVHRGGEEATVLVRDDGPPEALPGPGIGLLPDLCRRVLGLPTPPPPVATRTAFAVAWLDALLRDAAEGPPTGWESFPEVARRHPAAVGRPAPADPAELAALARAHAERWTWRALRAAPEVLPAPEGVLPRAVTAWMDDGAFARWCVGGFPDPEVLAHDVVSLLPARTAPLVVDAIARIVGPDGPAGGDRRASGTTP